MYVRGTPIIVLKPGSRGSEHASERFEQGGDVELDLLPRDDEIDMYRIIVEPLPATVVAAITGKRVHEIVEIPPFRGNCPTRGNDMGGDLLNRIADLVAVRARAVDRGTLVVFRPDPQAERDGSWTIRTGRAS